MAIIKLQSNIERQKNFITNSTPQVSHWVKAEWEKFIKGNA